MYVYCACVVCRAMGQHNREVMEMEDLLEQHLSEVHEDHQIKVRGWGGRDNQPLITTTFICILCVQSATKTKQLSNRFHTLLAARDQVIHQLVDKEDLLKKELQNKSRSEERLIEEKEGLLKVQLVSVSVCLLLHVYYIHRPIAFSRTSWTSL